MHNREGCDWGGSVIRMGGLINCPCHLVASSFHPSPSGT